MNYEIHPDWQGFIRTPESKWSLVDAALLIAQQLQTDSLAEKAKRRLQEIRLGLTSRVTKTASDYSRLQTLNEYFFVELGFQGNHHQFFDEQNSFLDRVIYQGKGIPITLSILYMELAQMVGLKMHGINFPGHFLVQLELDNEIQILDPFHNAQPLANDELEDLLVRHKVVLSDASEISGYLAVATKRDILIRLLRNLKNIYIEEQSSEKALLAIELILSLDDSVIDEIRDRGMIYHYLDYTAGALKDLRTYLKSEPDNEDQHIIQSLVDSLDEQITVIH